MASHLRIQEKCDLVIALTHMRLAEDMQVADATTTGNSRVDLLLGGHDHEVVRRLNGDTNTNSATIEQGCNNADITVDGLIRDTEGDIRIIKSGTDWRGLSLVRMMVQRDEDGTANISTVYLRQWSNIGTAPVPSSGSLSQISQMLGSIHSRVNILVQKPLLHASILLEGRSSVVRSQETNLGNMLADSVRAFYNIEIALFNSGAIRCDQVVGPTIPGNKPLLVKDIINICPFGNSLLVKRVSGRTLVHALENSIGDMHMDGRFLQISGLRVVATWQRTPGNRVLDVFLDLPGTVTHNIEPARMYTVAVPKFIADGFDGYTRFPAEETIIDPEAAITDTDLMLRIFGHNDKPNCDDHAIGAERARAVTIVGHNASDGLPIVNPVTDGRIRFIED
ncbi:2,3-cyclic-nucleotide 2-phosphodiesterase [Aspergillus sclerotialis]|uniref:2,3-cyclic-nucleotide 2-phosphodiesterase n=1 Tax=Aspergillus sclerotialis TaxID=2070753 RepID=A0A3A2ZCL9_9EURO|nr:2,3-cyclic-nucleotide 2-phosphodiesterase [Aspergillus sclerotialis]